MIRIRLGNGDLVIKLTEGAAPISEEELNNILRKIPFTLPKEFLDLYSESNGGIPDHSEVTDKKHIFPVHEFYDWSDIVFFRKDLDQYSVPSTIDYSKCLPFACDQGGNTYTLYFEQVEPEVYFYTTSDEMTVQGKWSSFSSFVNHFLK